MEPLARAPFASERYRSPESRGCVFLRLGTQPDTRSRWFGSRVLNTVLASVLVRTFYTPDSYLEPAHWLGIDAQRLPTRTGGSELLRRHPPRPQLEGRVAGQVISLVISRPRE